MLGHKARRVRPVVLADLQAVPGTRLRERYGSNPDVGTPAREWGAGDLRWSAAVAGSSDRACRRSDRERI